MHDGDEMKRSVLARHPDTISHDVFAPANFDEELAGPVHEAIVPTGQLERVSAIDILRGFALLGILVMNIGNFGGPETTHDLPLPNSLTGPHAHWNLSLLLFKWLFFEAKMRGIFSMLFGAGLLLLTSRAEKRGAAASLADIYTRRNMLLTLFGLLHGIFIWSGDILFDYGLQALLFLYPARKIRPKYLITIGVALSLTFGTLGGLLVSGSLDDFSLNRQVQQIDAQKQLHRPLSKADLEVEKKWAEDVASHRVTPEKIEKELAEGRAGYWSHVAPNVGGYLGPALVVHVPEIGDTLSAMLIGMGLYRIGFLSAQCMTSTYVWTASLGFLFSLPIYLYGILRAANDGLYFLTVDKWVWLPYKVTRNAGMIAITAVVLLIIKHEVWQAPQRWLAAVGRMALSNYILTSLICQFVFLWGPWKLYGTLEYYQLMYVVGGIWIVNLLTSVLWLSRFEYGPLEWMWRSLTYGKVQQFRLRVG